ncbi:helix-turn-helix transcriptional regulator [Microbacterium saccharophilum]|uniref:Helix-turn-helix transcriptional regulator n=1 Tax=Microbacterium saccharophilum TaxID=1213358 RepID=A0A5C8IB04_9MICO|nr:helix-turn-helix transcriptional regulator [Microbacterium saccharophilum]TXK15464.1 helix-turn-helix transcriptional regulator [Microbacterium saccharophilum]GEP47185.1 putative transcriptional regulator, LuxR family protein [Microbacterium saccharophilum]
MTRPPEDDPRETPPAHVTRLAAVAAVPRRHRPADALVAHIVDEALADLLAGDGPIRGVVVGPSGSGKSATLRGLRAVLRSRGVSVTAGPRPHSAHAVVIDDADGLDADEARALLDLAADQTTAIVIAHRPGPAPHVQLLAAELEKSRPPVLLGEVDDAAVTAAADIHRACAEGIVRLTDGVTWLALIAADAHHETECAGPADHHSLSRRLRAHIAHRLDSLDGDVRSAIEALCVFAPAEISRLDPPRISWDEAIAAGYAAGLLTQNGRPPVAVRDAVRTLLPPHRLTELVARAMVEAEAGHERWGGPASDSLGARLAARGDRERLTEPTRAIALYREAVAAGADPVPLAGRYGVAAMNAGDVEGAAACFDDILSHPDHPALADAVDATHAIWAARGSLQATAGALLPPASPVSAARTALAQLGVGERPEPAGRTAARPRDTLSIASAALASAVRDSLGHDTERAVDDLVHASELYSLTHSDFPLVEPPAVVAALAALGSGRPAVASAVLDAAIQAGQAGPWARRRLLLWRAWTHIHGAQPDDARSILDRLAAEGGAATPRDRLIAAACETALARRYANTATLMGVFRDASQHLLRQRFDLYLHPLLGELMLAAARVGAASAHRHMREAQATLDRLGNPPLWTPLLHWSGVQHGILTNRPELLVPHARALLAAAPHSGFAAQLAEAGRIWTEVLAGRVDTMAVEAAAHALARDGMAWDGARLAAHGAARSSDRPSYTQLLACARELHPRQLLQPEADRPEPFGETGDGTLLSAREVEVARLVLQGRTYVEIGQTLFISPRTAEHHIARIRRRLDATSRSDLLTKLHHALGAQPPSDKEGVA